MGKATEDPTLTTKVVTEAKSHAAILGTFVGSLWIIQIVNAISGGALTGFGIHPRTWSGLLGILFAPFLHASFAHLIANTIPLLVLGWFVMLRRKRDLFSVSAISAVVGGLGTWLIAPSGTVHIGASILIFGHLGYLLFRGIFERRFWPIVGSVLVFFTYGSALFGVLPGQPGISWQGHLFGLLGGILAAQLMKKSSREMVDTRKGPNKRIGELADSRARVPSVPAADVEEDEVEAELSRLRRMR